MKGQKTVELVDRVLSKYVDDVKVTKHNYDSTLYYPYRRTQSTEFDYHFKNSRHWIYAEIEDSFLHISLCAPKGPVFRLHYDRKGDDYELDKKTSRNYSSLARGNKILEDELGYE